MPQLILDAMLPSLLKWAIPPIGQANGCIIKDWDEGGLFLVLAPIYLANDCRIKHLISYFLLI